MSGVQKVDLEVAMAKNQKSELNRNKIFIREEEIPLLQFFSKTLGKTVTVELSCGEKRDEDGRLDNDSPNP